MTLRLKNKWVVLFGAMSSQLAIGALYSWSLFNKAISDAYGWELDDVVLTYAITLSVFALSMLFSGKVQLTKGPRFTSMIGAILYGGGVFLSAFATEPWMLYITYGVIVGTGVGFIYVCQLATIVKWFPNYKGLITGIGTAGFALGGFTFKFIYEALLRADIMTPDVIQQAFLTLGVIFTIMTVLGASLLFVPSDPVVQTKGVLSEGKQYTRREMVRTWNFWKLLGSDLLALMPGLLVIGLAKDIGMDYVNLDASSAADVVFIIALVNAAGRIASGSLADKLGALTIYRTMYMITIAALAALAISGSGLSYFVFIVAILAIAISYGSFLSLVPTIVGQLFGGKNFSANYGLVFLAYGLAAQIGPFIKRVSTGFNQTFYIAMATAAAGLILAMLINPNETRIPEAEVSNLDNTAINPI